MVNETFERRPHIVTKDAIIRLADRAFVIFAVIYVGAIAFVALSVDGVVFSQSGVIGGDFLAFYTAGEFALSGNALGAYDQSLFDASLKSHAPLDRLGMMWQYPPTMFFITAPFALLPYKFSYLAWCLAGWSALYLALRSVGFRDRNLRLLALSPLCLFVFDNGQISLVTAALLILASYAPKRRWLIAGIAAGLLTIKPQLGILLPLAFAAVGAWRTILVAAITAILLHMPSMLIFGAEGWRDFIFAVARLNTDFTGQGALTPPQNMTTLFGQLRVLGAPADVALHAQYAAAAAIAASVVIVWKRQGSALSKSAILCAGAILAAPYAYGYEMAALLIPAVVIVKAAQWPTSRLSIYIVACWGLLILGPSIIGDSPINLPFVISASAFAVTLGLSYAKPVLKADLRAAA